MGNKDSRIGYRIMKIKDNSPAVGSSVESMLDFLLYPPPDAKSSCPSFSEYVTSNENKEIELSFYNIATRKVHKCRITPRKWEGEGLLGFEINEEDYLVAHNRVIRILDFFLNSPLYKAGFQPNTDYIIGTENFIFDGVEEFTTYIQRNNKKAVDLQVYSSKEGKVRSLTLTPDVEWGGSGYLGGDIGIGHLHSLPVRRESPGEDSAETNDRSSDSLGVSERDILVGDKEVKVNDN
eukprot:TRINITY_DN4996_c0_g1_i10.p2 TRINITY_DN4996_c0_g1~~TRINITY_DN4996_c0_g1_i10.p2  ORF type:complete len:236 (-),score=58.88 TRINITY_DN4996_c0_g1_i10:93-800(-)